MKLSVNSLVLSMGLLVGGGGCAAHTPAIQGASQAAPSAAASYAAALDEAFTAYEGEVDRASKITFMSEAEKQAVIASLSEAHFDWILRQALARRGLSVNGLADFALENPDFFHAEQQRYWGRLERAQDRMRHFEVVPSESPLISMAETTELQASAADVTTP